MKITWPQALMLLIAAVAMVYLIGVYYEYAQIIKMMESAGGPEFCLKACDICRALKEAGLISIGDYG